MALTSTPSLVRQPAELVIPRKWDAAAQRVFAHAGGVLRVLGGPGTGKTTLLAELVVDRIARSGADPERILVLTASRTAAAALRSTISALLANAQSDDTALRARREPLVRTVHSYAFSVLRLQAVRNGTPQPKLLTGSEQDALIRDLLAGDLDLGADYWPARLRPALLLPGFAAELRDLILKAAERGLGHEDLVALGREHDCQEWIAAGTFWQQYEQVTLLRGWSGRDTARAVAPALDAAELVSSALLACRTDPDVLEREHERVRHLFVDDAQHFDPQQYRLVRTVGGSAHELVLFGDPDQAVFSFRGADPALLAGADDGNTEVLTTCYRMADEVLDAVSKLRARLPGTGPQRNLVRAEKDKTPGCVQARLFSSAAREAAWIADQLRRAHLLDGVAWSDMAVLVRSTAFTLPVLRRALLAAGIPVAMPTDSTPLAQLPAIRPFLVLLRCAADAQQLDQDAASYLLESVLGGSDPLVLRRLLRGLRQLEVAAGGRKSSGELLVEVLHSGENVVAIEHAAVEPALRIAELLRIAGKSIAAGASAHQVLWELWQASGLEQRWITQASRGGPVGAQADRDLDAVVALIDAATRYTERFPGHSIAAFVEHLSSRQIVEDSLAPTAPAGDAVSVLTAHAAVGREWAAVAVQGLQEGTWPDLRIRGTLFRVERLIDLLAGIRPNDVVSLTAPLLAEERRLLVLAASRAKQRLLICAVNGEDEQPSRFFDELVESETDQQNEKRLVAPAQRGLAFAELIGELRQVVCDPGQDQDRRGRAAAQLAKLAAAGVPGAHPDSWYGLSEVTVDSPLWTEDELVSVSPSTIEVLAKCPLRWMVERHGGVDPAPLASITGTLVHALVQAVAEGVSGDALTSRLDQAWAKVDAGAPWFSRRERERVQRMLDTFRGWFTQSRGELTQVAVEHDVSIKLPAKSGGPWLRVRGRVDRLEVDNQGRPVVVDIKTGKSPVTKNEAEQHPQLAVYQLAAQLGAFGELGVKEEPGGARLLYVSKDDKTTGAAERTQQPLDETTTAQWLNTVQDAAAASVGPTYLANQNTDCPRCPAQICCPLQESGRQLGQTTPCDAQATKETQ